MREIILNNRYKVINKLIEFNENEFYLELGDPKELDFCRVGWNPDEHSYEDKEFIFIDPSGGPFITIGTKFEEVPDMKVIRIYEKSLTNKEDKKFIIKFG